MVTPEFYIDDVFVKDSKIAYHNVLYKKLHILSKDTYQGINEVDVKEKERKGRGRPKKCKTINIFNEYIFESIKYLNKKSQNILM